MSAVEMDRQAIERRDFPIVRRGYDPASVDAHLHALSTAVEQLRAAAAGPGRDTLASAAGAQVQGILEAAQASAQAIEQEAAEHAARVRAEAEAAARATREQAISAAQERVGAVTQATDALLERVASMDGETRTLVESLRAGAGRLVADLQALSDEMAGLYDAAAGQQGGGAAATGGAVAISGAAATGAAPIPPAEVQQSAEVFAPARVETPIPFENGVAPAEPEGEAGVLFDDEAESLADADPVAVPVGGSGDDLDGARLVALNMALNGDSREATGRYLAENFRLPDPAKLLDEVYAAIEA
ncbi:MAG TPA: hypothetical protein VHU13_08140 [Solirubrobacteraceae bacterium]|jgi:hypothetical protein|nr:hypothetical protein [Solirubrobacteraceae bacterium]